MTQENGRELIVKATDAGTRLDRFLADSAPELSRSRIQALIREGFVTVNGGAPRARDIVHAGDRIAMVEPPVQPIDLVPEKVWLMPCCRIAKIFPASAARNGRALFIGLIRKQAAAW